MNDDFQSDQNSNEPPAGSSLNGELHDGATLITAYALGELNEAERAQIEARLHESPDELQAVEELSRLGKLLRKVVADSPLLDCSSGLREAVLDDLAHPPAEPPLRLPERFPRRATWLRLSLAASLAVMCGTLVALTKTKSSDRMVAQSELATLHSGVVAEGIDEVTDLSTDPVMTHPVQEPSRSYFSAYSTSGKSLGDTSGIGDGETRPSDESPAAVDYFAVDGPLSGRDIQQLVGDKPDGGVQGREMAAEGERREIAPSQFGFGGGQRPNYGAGMKGGEGQANGGMGGGMMPGGLSPRPARESHLGGRMPKQRALSAANDPSGGSDSYEERALRGGLLVGGRGRPEASPVTSNHTDLGRHGDGAQANGAGERDARPDLAAARARYEYQKKQYAELRELDRQRGSSGSQIREAKAQVDLAKDALDAATVAADNGGQRADQAGQALGEAKKEDKLLYTWHVEGLAITESQPRNGTAYFYVPNTESYAPLIENPFHKPTEYPLSTFSVDVDTASYTNVRRFLTSRAMPPPDAVRVEELINYFQFSYPQPDGDVPFSITTDMADCPWNAEHRLLRIGLKGRDLPADERPASNLVFLLDVSGSMEAANKLPLVKEAMYLLTDRLTENDRVAIVVYAGNSGLVLPPTNGTNKAAIRNAIAQLVASGSTNGGQGLQMAYDTAQSQFIKGGTNRVILATDGDFNVGIVDQNDLVKLIEEKAKSGVFLSALGFGVGNLKDGTLEKLADKGNGNYAYVDTLGEARRVLVEQLSGTLVTIAKDVKLQIEFNPAQAAEYRLIGYENRALPPQDFSDDRKDAGEIGAGHTVTALYEIVPAAQAAATGVEPLKYQRSEQLTPAANSHEVATIKLRYKSPEADESRLIERVVTDHRPQQPTASADFSFAAAVAEFGLLLRESPYRGAASYKAVLELAEQGLPNDSNGYRSEFIGLVRQAQEISDKE
ncbi:MAG TPA: von Willebrand factor type A domain-containing protein [Pirellulales bacterium]|nr:von Willebrand factor type A domain-containing protein [Pirellulales bacterium]